MVHTHQNTSREWAQNANAGWDTLGFSTSFKGNTASQHRLSTKGSQAKSPLGYDLRLAVSFTVSQLQLATPRFRRENGLFLRAQFFYRPLKTKEKPGPRGRPSLV